MTAGGSGLAGEAYAIIRQRILRGELVIGQVISRRTIADELGMSFLPVSEALLRLEFEGLLESRPRAGTRVRIPTRQDVKGHYVVREALEMQAARLFAELATEEERAELLRLADRVDATTVQSVSSRAVYPALHAKLHRRIAECGRCPSLSEAIEKSHALAAAWLCGAKCEASVAPHRRLLEKLCAGSPDDAAEAMRQHVASSLDSALIRLEPFFRIRKIQGSIYSRRSHIPLVKAGRAS